MIDRIIALGREWHLGMPLWVWALLLGVGLLNETIERMGWTRAGSILQGFARFIIAFPAFGPLLVRLPFVGELLRWLAKMKPADVPAAPSVANLPPEVKP